MKHLRWLHISDLHAGQDTQDWLWPTLQTNFFEDIERIFPALGGLDLVIFSGDLTQRGAQRDFDVLRQFLDRAWEKFDKLGSKPSLFMVPGNHDLVRPDESDPISAALRSWWQNPHVKEAFWSSKKKPYRDFLEKLFSNYSQFKKQLHSDGFPLCATVDGMLPGDTSTVLSKDGLRLGIVGLNSSYLQLFDRDGPKLDLDVRQLLSVTNQKPDDWCRENHINLLVTHHPVSWLDENAAQHFLSEIYLPRRFNAHLFGHMHEPEIGNESRGGSKERRSIQAASLYGLRKFGPNRLERVHGYSAARVDFDNSEGRIVFWPRIDKVVASGSRRFAADTKLDLSEQNTFEWNLGKLEDGLGNQVEAVDSLNSFGSAQQEASLASQMSLSGVGRHPLKSGRQHIHVRRLEQGKLKAAIESKRTAWICADWGYAVEEFMATVVSTLSSPISDIYRLDLHEYDGRDNFLAKFQSQTGRTFQDFCKAISGAERTLVMLKDVPVSRGAVSGKPEWQIEIEDIVEAIKEYCPNSIIVLISRQLPNHEKIPCIEIKPLDDADVRTYITDHPAGGKEKAGTTDIADIARLTGGVPTEIDSILKELDFISLPELIELRLTSPRLVSQEKTGHEGIFPVVEELKNSKVEEISHAFNLLVALSAFPYGETLSRIRRFDPTKPFYPSHAAILADRGLIESVSTMPVLNSVSPSNLQSPKLMAKAIVRKRVEELLDVKEIDLRNDRAAKLYFGDNWRIGEPRSIRTVDLVKALGGDGGLGNPHVVINSMLQRAVESSDDGLINKIIKIARLFVANLYNGDHYRSCASACLDFLRILPDNGSYTGDRNWFKFNLAISWRMLGRKVEAAEIFDALENVRFEKKVKQRILLNWALVTQSTDKERAKEIANQAVALDKKSSSGLHAQALVLQLSPEQQDRFNKLRILEARARAQNLITVANAIAHFIATNSGASADEKRNSLRKIAFSARRNGDPYSAAQAIVGIGRIIKDERLQLTQDELSALIEAYHYLYNQRMGVLFRRCHEGLWSHFVGGKDIENLLRLFRHSSFIWRVHGEENLEVPYVEKLSTLLSGENGRWVQNQSIESAYFLIRAERVRRNTSIE